MIEWEENPVQRTVFGILIFRKVRYQYADKETSFRDLKKNADI